MDLRVYYQKIRKIEADIPEEHAVIVSRDTPDGGRRGVKSQVPRYLAARMIAEDKAQLASAEEAAEFHAENAEARERAEQAAASLVPAPVRPAQKQGKRS